MVALDDAESRRDVAAVDSSSTNAAVNTAANETSTEAVRTSTMSFAFFPIEEADGSNGCVNSPATNATTATDESAVLDPKKSSIGSSTLGSSIKPHKLPNDAKNDCHDTDTASLVDTYTAKTTNTCTRTTTTKTTSSSPYANLPNPNATSVVRENENAFYMRSRIPRKSEKRTWSLSRTGSANATKIPADNAAKPRAVSMVVAKAPTASLAVAKALAAPAIKPRAVALAKFRRTVSAVPLPKPIIPRKQQSKTTHEDAPTKPSIRRAATNLAMKTPATIKKKPETKGAATVATGGEETPRSSTTIWKCPTCAKQFEFRRTKTVNACIRNHMKTHDRKLKKEEDATRLERKASIMTPSTTSKRSSPRFADSCFPTSSEKLISAKQPGRPRRSVLSMQTAVFTEAVCDDANVKKTYRTKPSFFAVTPARRTEKTARRGISERRTPARAAKTRSKMSSSTGGDVSRKRFFVTPTAPKNEEEKREKSDGSKLFFSTPDTSDVIANGESRALSSIDERGNGCYHPATTTTPAKIVMASSSCYGVLETKMTFPEIVHALVSDATESMPEVVCWNDVGNAFIVKDRGEPLRPLLRKYFRHNNYTSLYRQLTNYGWTAGEHKGSFRRDGFARDSKRADLRRVTRKGSEATTTVKRKKPKLPSLESSPKRNTAVVRSPTRALSACRSRPSAPKRKAFANACSGIQSSLTEQEKHENVDTYFDEDSDEESVGGGVGIAQEKLIHSAGKGCGIVSSGDRGKNNYDVSFGDENTPLGKKDTKEEMNGCVSENILGSLDKQKTPGRPQKRSKKFACITSSQFMSIEVTPPSIEPSREASPSASKLVVENVHVPDEEYDRFQYSNLFRWSPIKTLHSPAKSSRYLQKNDSKSFGTPSRISSIANTSNLFPRTGTWSQNETITQSVSIHGKRGTRPKKRCAKSQSDARKRPIFSPITLQDFTGVTFHGMSSEPSTMTPSKEQVDNVIQFSWHSRSTIGSMTGLPEIDVDSLLGDIGEYMIDFVVGASNFGSPEGKTRPSTPTKRENALRLASPFSVTPKKRRVVPVLTGMPSISPCTKRKRQVAPTSRNGKQLPCLNPIE